MPDASTKSLAAELMLRFAARTGVTGAARPQRYLWTDAFAVCNFLGLARERTGPFAALAADLVEQVHYVLGRHRDDDSRRGWISGLGEAAGATHPTRGGLRIGKPLPERGAGQPPDPELEWERDGQYFHYLTRWMHALDQFARASGRPEANRWACELAQAAQAGFLHAGVDGQPRLVWKMSIDLSRPQVASMGQHDPLDGLVTYRQLQAHRDSAGDAPDLSAEIDDMGRIARGGDWRTDDPLGLGGLLVDAWWLTQLPPAPAGPQPAELLAAALPGLAAYLQRQPLEQPPTRRLAFRELGLAIGLHAVARMRALPALPAPLREALDTLAPVVPLAAAIEDCWCTPAHRQAESWLAHHDINGVMLATSLLPDGYLDLP